MFFVSLVGSNTYWRNFFCKNISKCSIIDRNMGLGETIWKSNVWRILMKQKIMVLLQGFLVAIALTSEFHMPLQVASYETKLDYIIASIYELLGEYNFQFILVWLLGTVFFYFMKDRVECKKNTSIYLASFFSLCLVFGRSYYETDSSAYVLGSAVNFVKSVFVFAGYFCLIYALLAFLFVYFKNTSFTDDKSHFFSKYAFLKSFIILSIVYGIVILISYPGTLCWDVIGQIEQVTKGTGYSTHHPIAHTLLVGGLTQLGKTAFGSYEVGLFLYMLVQMVMLNLALSLTVSVLAKRGLKKGYLVTLLTLYCITPLYTNIVSVAIKDVPYCAFVIGYVVLFTELLEKPEKISNKKFSCGFVLVQIGVILSRNNGLPLVLLSGILAFIYFYKKYNLKEKILYLLSGFALSIAIAKLVVFVLMQVTNATEGSSAEMLSIPFQQTARYLQLYQDEIDIEEKEAIEAVLGDVSVVAAKYNPEISDDVKALFVKEATTKDIVNYMGAWAKGFLKHPGVYFEAFFIHVHGWFTPVATNAIRYETTYTEIAQEGLFNGAQKGLIFLYRFANRIPFLGLLENIGAYVWGLFFFIFYAKKNKENGLVFASLPLVISLLVCMASPCFISHPRYGMPIICTLPFLYGFMLSKTKEEAV